jgi:rhamnose utilization protein RhaD (predicted bifunctional aldolase and dehydrogenase)
MVQLEELIRLSHRIGRPDNGYVILAEGNTSTRLHDDTFLVKCAGARLENVTPSDFVRLRLKPLLEEAFASSGGDVRELLAAVRVDPSPGDGAPSIETLVHAVALGIGGARYVAHTHPTFLTGLLCSRLSEDILMAGPLFPDEVVICGTAPLYVPYFEPGIAVAHALARALQEYQARCDASPRTILLQNHGLVALGESAADAEAVTAMAAKAAQVRAIALLSGGQHPLPVTSVGELARRPDEQARRARVVGGT